MHTQVEPVDVPRTGIATIGTIVVVPWLVLSGYSIPLSVQNYRWITKNTLLIYDNISDFD